MCFWQHAACDPLSRLANQAPSDIADLNRKNKLKSGEVSKIQSVKTFSHSLNPLPSHQTNLGVSMETK